MERSHCSCSLRALKIPVQLLCPRFPFWNKLSAYLQIFLSSEQAQKAQESLSWAYPAQNIRQNTKAELRESCSPSALGTAHHTGHHAKERRSKPIPNSFCMERMDETANETNALRQTFQVSLTARAFLGQLRWSPRGLFQLP